MYMICSRLFAEADIRPVNRDSRGTHVCRYTLTHKLLLNKEDAESMAARLAAVRSSKPAGLAAWRLGMETPEVWTLFERYFSGADLSGAAGP